jgi:hypothetical protein
MLWAGPRIGPAGEPLSATAELEAGPGAINPPGRVPIAALRVEASAEPGRLRVARLTLRLTPAVPDAPGPTLTAPGYPRRDGARWQAEAELALDRARLDRLEARAFTLHAEGGAKQGRNCACSQAGCI